VDDEQNVCNGTGNLMKGTFLGLVCFDGCIGPGMVWLVRLLLWSCGGC